MRNHKGQPIILGIGEGRDPQIFGWGNRGVVGSP